MSPLKDTLYLKLLRALAVLALCTVSAPLLAQVERPLTWSEDLRYLDSASNISSAEQRTAVIRIRAEVEKWLKLHPDSKIVLKPAPAEQPWSAAETGDQVRFLRETVEEILREDPSRPFHLGVEQVTVEGSASTLSPVAGSIDLAEIQSRNDVNVTKAIEDLSGVSIAHVGKKNQTTAYVHGFGVKQVPLFLDGIPMNVPYDASLDLGRFQTSDLAEIQVAKGFSSPLMGPNALGGAINLVTRQPQKKLEGEASMGTYSGNGLLSSLLIGSRWTRFFVMGTLDWLQSDYVPLSGNFVTNALQPNYDLNHSNSQDAKYSGRFGWTPRGRDQYVFSFINQKANEGIPLNTGNDPLPLSSCFAGSASCWTKNSYRQWNYWNKTSYYFHSNTGIGEKNSLKTRVFYDQYQNLMLFYNKLPYTQANLNTSAGANTAYDDHTQGFSTEFESRLIPRNVLSTSFFFKDDTHKLNLLVPYKGMPGAWSDRQQLSSIGLQDVYSISSRLTATFGFSADHLNGLRATDTNTNLAFVSGSGCNTTNTNPTSFSACTPHFWGYNPQASISYALGNAGHLFAGFARKTRFPTMDEMFSYKKLALGPTSLANPSLVPEHSNNWTFGYSHVFTAKTLAQVELFRSDFKDAIQSNNFPSALCPGNTPPFVGTCNQNQNVGKEVHQGIEFTTRSTPLPRLTLDANYTYLNVSIGNFYDPATNGGFPCGLNAYLAVNNGQTTKIGYNTCRTPIELPKHKAVASAVLRLPFQSSLISSVRYESGTKAIDSFSSNKTTYYEVLRMSNFATVDLGGTIPIHKAFTAQAGVKNLFDRNAYYVLGYPEEGRNWYLTLRYRL